MSPPQDGPKLTESPELIPVREDEVFDYGRVAAYLRGKLPGSEQPLEVVQFSGGHANLTYLLRFGAREYVLRRPPLGPVAATAHDMGREYRVLSVLYQKYPLAPRAFVYCDDATLIGAPFFVMERRCGTVVRRAIPAAYGGGTDAVRNRQISEVLVDALADLHDVDYRAIGLEGLGKPDGFMQRQIDGWTARYERSKTRDLPIVTQVSQWLTAHLPPSAKASLLHNDWRLDNMMLDSADPSRAVAVFDWDMCTIGDPLADLGTVLASWVEANEGFSGGAMPSGVPGFMTRREAVERYCQRRGIDPAVVPYYFVFGLFKIAVVLQQIYHRYHLGQTKDARFAVFEQLAEMLFQMAATRAEHPGL
jgi:aminoglycoside phosphotransferase (APT) family kinase protein